MAPHIEKLLRDKFGDPRFKSEILTRLRWERTEEELSRTDKLALRLLRDEKLELYSEELFARPPTSLPVEVLINVDPQADEQTKKKVFKQACILYHYIYIHFISYLATKKVCFR